MNEAISIIHRNDLRQYLKVLFNNPFIMNPYHNLYHTFTVVKYCNLYSERMIYFDLEEKRCLLLAAMFHDAGHTGSSNPDYMNIENAINALYSAVLSGNRQDEHLLDRTIQIIQATEYPYSNSEQDEKVLDISKQIIRDADRSQAFEFDTFEQHLIIGLAREQQITVKESIALCFEFWQTTGTFYTPAGKHMYDIKVPQIMNTLRDLEHIQNY